MPIKLHEFEGTRFLCFSISLSEIRISTSKGLSEIKQTRLNAIDVDINVFIKTMFKQKTIKLVNCIVLTSFLCIGLLSM